MYSGCPTWKSVTSDNLATHERISLITVIFSDQEQIEIVTNLSGDDVQLFVDRIVEVLDCLAPHLHKKCLLYLYTVCGRHTLLPKSLRIPLCFNPADATVYHGGLTDVWKGQHDGRDVAAQVFGILQGGDAEKIRRRFYGRAVAWRALRHPNILPLLGVTVTENRLMTVSEWMPNGNIGEFTKANPHMDRLGILRGVVRGLIYMHDRGLVHGDIKGTTILIDNDGRARLAGLNLITVASNEPMSASVLTLGDSIPWMSPELLYPEKYAFEDSRPTMQSDCYALGMVIFEVLSEQVPFAACRDPEIVLMVLDGERPKRPQGDDGGLFTDEIWKVLGHCWKEQPGDRPSAKDVLAALEQNHSPSWSYPDVDEGEVDTDSQSVINAGNDHEVGMEESDRNSGMESGCEEESVKESGVGRRPVIGNASEAKNVPSSESGSDTQGGSQLSVTPTRGEPNVPRKRRWGVLKRVFQP